MSEQGEISLGQQELSSTNSVESQLMRLIPASDLVEIYLKKTGKNKAPEGLTNHQAEILKLYFKGFERGSISQKVNNTQRTSSNLLDDIKNKLEVNGGDETLRTRIWDFIKKEKSEGTDLILAGVPSREEMVEMFIRIKGSSLNLSPVEREILLFSFQDLTTKKISEMRNRSQQTIKNQIPVLKNKLGISSKAEIIAHVWETLENAKDNLISQRYSASRDSYNP